MVSYNYVGYINDSIAVQEGKKGIEKLIGSDAQVRFEFDDEDMERWCYLTVDAETPDEGCKYLSDTLKLGQYFSSLYHKPHDELA
ncbi:MAG: hypothetical protein AABX05_05620 [Nanoarchaeota archaeon]